ncbi:MAG TPA: ABC transporter permease [Bryobacteraceae bacterium]|nr:ABC transporter permease [Bryobacteraceae bacterium]
MPDWKQIVRERLDGLKLDGAREIEIVDELAQHLEDRYDALRAAGIAESQAHNQILEELTGNGKLAEELRKIRRPPAIEPMGVPKQRGGLMSGFVSDLKIAFRNMHTKLSFSLMVVGMLTLGVGGNAAIFSIFNGLFLRPMPFADAEQLIDLDETAPKWNLKYVGVSNPDFFAWRKSNSTFDGMAVFAFGSLNLSDRGTAQRVLGGNVTYDLLPVLGLKPVIGRNFTSDEDKPGGAKVAMLGYDLWHRLYQGDRGVLGRVLQLDNESYTVIGVLPREAVLPDRVDVWTPLAADPDPKKSNGWYLSGVGRLKHGVSMEQASADLTRIHKAMIGEGQKVNEITSPVLTPLRERYLGDYRSVSRILLGGVAVVLLIACVNIAALMMVRGSSRAREIAIRTAIGASRSRIIRQLLTENLALALAGGILGVGLGSLCLRAMVALVPEGTLPSWIAFSMDARFAIFCVAITGAAALISGLLPAFQASRIDTRGSLQDSGVRSTLTRGRRLTLGSLVVCEIGLALMLSVGAGLLVQAFRKVLSVDPGYRPENVILFRVNLPDTTYKKPEQCIAFFENLVERMRAVPGVKSAAATSAPPMGGHWGNFWEAEGAKPLGPNDKNPVVLQVVATPGYFDALGMTFLAGRPFNDQESDAKFIHTAVVNETFAKYYWKNESAIGKRVRYQGSTGIWIQVVGVTRDEKHYGLDQEMKPSIFLPLHGLSRNSMAIVLRTTIEPQMLVAPARQILRQMDADLPMYDVRTMTERLSRSLWARRSYSWLFGAFAIVAVVLASAGIYGVISYAVSQRTQEIGIRMALGAQPGQVLRQTLAGGMLLVTIGVVIGFLGALGAVRLLQTLLFGVSPRDPLIFTAVIIGVAAVGLLANFVPARRAASIDPMRALHFE